MTIEFFVGLRDLCNAEIERMTPEEAKPTVSEDNFALNFTEYTSPKLGTYGVAEEKGNLPEKWNRALNILKQANATISNRYHGEGYQFGFWTYEGKIYRQALKTK